MCLVNLKCKNATISIQSKQFEVDTKRSTNFIQQLRKEVEALSKQERKKVKRELKLMSVTFLSTLNLATPALANSKDHIVSPDFTNFLTELIVAAVIVGVLMSTLAWVSSGIVQLFPRTEEFVAEWSQNIIKGFGRIILATPVIMMMVLLFHLMFGKNPHLVDVWRYLPIFQN